MTKDTRKRFDAEVAKLAPPIRAAFIQAIADLQSVAQITAIEAAIDRGDVEAVFQALRLGPEFFAPLDDAIRAAYIGGGGYALASLPKVHPGTGRALVVRFQGRAPRAERWLTDHSSRLIVEIVAAQRDAVAEAVRVGMEAGRHPRSTALDIVGRIDAATKRRKGGIVGLTSREAGYVRNMRAELSDPAKLSSYFDRAARDKRFDKTVRRAIREGRALKPAEIERISGRYSDILLRKRGERIARTEALTAFSQGRSEGMQQLIDSGEVPAQAITKVWDASGDARVREDHAQMDGQTVGWDEAFVAPDGSRMMHPRDTSLGASGAQTIQCRCYMQQRVDWLSMAV